MAVHTVQCYACAYSIPRLQRGDIARLKGLNWLNDILINYFMTMVVKRSEADPTLPKIWSVDAHVVSRSCPC